MMPANAKKRHLSVEDKLNRMAKDASGFAINKAEYKDLGIGIITSGIPYQYVKEVMPDASVLKLGCVHPLPKELICEFASKVDKLYIVEELEPVIEEQVKSWGIDCKGKELFTVQGEYSANMIRAKLLNEPVDYTVNDAPMRPPILCPGCPHRSTFSVLKKLKIHAEISDAILSELLHRLMLLTQRSAWAQVYLRFMVWKKQREANILRTGLQL